MNDSRFVWADRGWWRFPDGHRRLLTWNEGSKLLVFAAIHRWEDDRPLARFENEAALPAELAAYADHIMTPDGLEWLHGVLVLTAEPVPAGLGWLAAQAAAQKRSVAHD